MGVFVWLCNTFLFVVILWLVFCQQSLIRSLGTSRGEWVYLCGRVIRFCSWSFCGVFIANKAELEVWKSHGVNCVVIGKKSKTIFDF